MSTRSAPVYDGRTGQDYQLSFDSYPKTAIAGDDYRINVVVDNQGTTGAMFIECGFQNLNAEGAWLKDVRQASIGVLETRNNCVLNQPFMQTIQVNMTSSEEPTEVEFIVETPGVANASYVIYCGAFERCYARGVDTGVSDIIISENVQVYSSNETAATGSGVTGTPIDGDDTSGNNDDKIANSSIKIWVRDHSMIVLLIGLFLVIIGSIVVYAEPKRSIFG